MQDVQAQSRAQKAPRVRAKFVGAGVLALALGWTASPASAVVVHGKFGGEILGYDVDRNGSEGVLSENASDGTIATETFDQTTGKILKVVAKKRNSIDNMITLGVVGTGTGLFETAICCKNGFVKKRVYAIIDPLSGNQQTAAWTPGLARDQIILSVSENQGSDTTAVLAFTDTGQEPTFVFTSNVAANTVSSFVPSSSWSPSPRQPPATARVYRFTRRTAPSWSRSTGWTSRARSKPIGWPSILRRAPVSC